MSSSVNLLGLPAATFGLAGIHIGNLVSREVAKQDKGFRAQYDPARNKITILNTSDLPPSVLHNLLYETPASREYDSWTWYPVINEERNTEGNLEIHFSPLKPGVDHLRGPCGEFILTSISGYYAGSFPVVLPPTSTEDRRSNLLRARMFYTIEKGPIKEFQRLA
ncbi:MAG: hypothetical protein NTX49_01570 [Chlamydiae bacterium]|nr:hypothetical protein [Chlamydiota bacterium]